MGYWDDVRRLLQNSGVMATAPAPAAAPGPPPGAPPASAPVDPAQGSMMGGLISLSSPRGVYDAAQRSGVAGLTGLSPRTIPQALTAPGGPSAAPSPDVVQQARQRVQDEQSGAAAAGAQAGGFAGQEAATSGGIFAASFGGGGAGGGPGGATDLDLIGPKTRDAYERAFANQRGALDVDRDTALKNGALQKQFFEGGADELRGVQARTTKTEADRQARATSYLDRLESERQRFANAKIDPDHYWNSKGTGEKVGLMFAELLSGVGGHNGAVVQQVNHAIDRDIDAQKHAIATKGEALAQGRGLYADMLRTFGDAREAESATKRIMLDRLQMQGQAMAAETGSNTAMARAAQANAQLDAQYADYLAKTHKWLPYGLAAGGGAVKSTIPQENLVPLPGGGYVAAADKEDARDLKTLGRGSDEYGHLINEAIQLRDGSSTWWIPGTSDHKKLDQIQQDLLTVTNDMAKSHRVTEADREVMRQLSGSVTDLGPGTAEALKRGSSHMQRKFQIALQGEGVMGARTGFARDPRTGQLVPVAEYTGERYAPGAAVPMQRGPGFQLLPPGAPIKK